jgi:hypothetical protein
MVARQAPKRAASQRGWEMRAGAWADAGVDEKRAVFMGLHWIDGGFRAPPHG